MLYRLLWSYLCLALSLQAVDWEAVESLPSRTKEKIFRDRVVPQWEEDEKLLWYTVRTGPGKKQYVSIDTATGQRREAPTFRELGLPEPKPLSSSQLSTAAQRSGKQGEETEIHFRNDWTQDVDLFWLDTAGKSVRYGRLRVGMEQAQHTYAGHVWLMAKISGERLATVEATARPLHVVIDGKGSEPAQQRKSSDRPPDVKWRMLLKDDLTITRLDDNRSQTFPTKHPVHGNPSWAPDSETFVLSMAAEVWPKRMAFIQSSPKGSTLPVLRDDQSYARAGDPLPAPVPLLLRLKGEHWQMQEIDSALFPTPFTQSHELPVKWARDGTEFYFDYNERGHQLYRVLAVNRETGAVRVVVEERSETFIDYTEKTWRHWLAGGKELLWMSERDGWCHVYLYDVATGKVKRQVTSGSWVVREVLHVDEQQRVLWFMASGTKPGQDPYYQQLCRVSLDEGDMVQLTEAEAEHDITFSPSRKWFVDAYSRVDLAPVHELRSAVDGRLVSELEHSDLTALTAAGWSVPERFTAKGRDGKTDIYGLILKPSHFDASKRYPVLEEVYAGPHGAFVPKAFTQMLRMQQLAELGFIIVKADGMGTNYRGKAFHEVCWKNLKDAGFPDRIAWIKAAAKERPWMDLSRVGIYGGSAGGQSAMRALLDHADFYHAAVADCGCHDNRVDKIWWNEQWMGYPVDESYAKNSNVTDAHKLRGDLLLIVGELDTNVDPASTLQVVGALQRAGKAFQVMPIIGTGHGAAETAYGSKLRMQFFVEKLRPDLHD